MGTLLDLGAAFQERFAHLLRREPGQILVPLAERYGKPAQAVSALGRRSLPPALCS
jgi:hypothetical protein